MKDQRVSLSHIMLAPRGMTPALLMKIQSDVQASVTSDAVKDKLLGLGVQTNWRDGVELAKSVLLESPATAALVQELGLKP
jgi:tripartite-type tricarboxylate transporter receptor subunit TctC